MEYTKEDMAKDALIVAALRSVEFEKEVSQNDLLCYSTNGPELSLEDKKALAALGSDLFAKGGKPRRNSQDDIAIPPNSVLEESVMAMNRKNADDNISEATKKEIDQKREEIRKKLEEERKKKNDGKAHSGTC